MYGLQFSYLGSAVVRSIYPVVGTRVSSLPPLTLWPLTRQQVLVRPQFPLRSRAALFSLPRQYGAQTDVRQVDVWYYEDHDDENHSGLGPVQRLFIGLTTYNRNSDIAAKGLYLLVARKMAAPMHRKAGETS